MISSPRVIYNLLAIIAVFLFLVGLNALVTYQWEKAKEAASGDTITVSEGVGAPSRGDSPTPDSMAAADTSGQR